MVAPAHNHAENYENLQELTLWMGASFTLPHSGRLMILPVDQNAGHFISRALLISCNLSFCFRILIEYSCCFSFAPSVCGKVYGIHNSYEYGCSFGMALSFLEFTYGCSFGMALFHLLYYY